MTSRETPVTGHEPARPDPVGNRLSDKLSLPSIVSVLSGEELAGQVARTIDTDPDAVWLGFQVILRRPEVAQRAFCRRLQKLIELRGRA